MHLNQYKSVDFDIASYYSHPSIIILENANLKELELCQWSSHNKNQISEQSTDIQLEALLIIKCLPQRALDWG